jgi:hypothetical protein
MKTKLAAVIAVVAVTTVMLATAGLAHVATVTGIAVCDETTGNWIVDWSATNGEAGQQMTIESTDPDVTFTPNPVPNSGTAPAQQTLPGTTTGAVTLTVDASWPDGFTISDTGEVTLVGTCEESPEPPPTGPEPPPTGPEPPPTGPEPPPTGPEPPPTGPEPPEPTDPEPELGSNQVSPVEPVAATPAFTG